MAPFDVTYRDVPDERISDLLAVTNAAGFASPTMTPASSGEMNGETAHSTSRTADALDGEAGLPEAWRLIRELEGQSYAWPELREAYAEYRVYAGETEREGTVHIALGKSPRYATWGRKRTHVVAFLTSGSPQTPLAEFVGTDDFDETRELIAVIRGRDGLRSKKMFSPGDSLPAVYRERFRTGLFSDRLDVRGAWAKVGVLAREDEPDVMLDHALVQARRRGDL
jgi:hypothetical protein